METTTLAQEVSAIDWYHSIDLPGGIRTPGGNNSQVALSRLGLPASFAGKTVLDIGAWDGFYSFEAAKRGAAQVLATDSYVWDRRWGQQGFNLARHALGYDDKVQDRNIDLMDLSPEALGGKFDVTFFLGVLYHVTDPVVALERVASVTNELLILETETALNYLPFPAARLWPTDELNADKTNWWSINQPALLAMLRALGFRDIRVIFRTSMPRRAARAVMRSDRTLEGLRAGFASARIVIHARR